MPKFTDQQILSYMTYTHDLMVEVKQALAQIPFLIEFVDSLIPNPGPEFEERLERFRQSGI